MFFRNATFFRIAPALLQAIIAPQDDAETPDLETALAACPLKPIAPLELGTYGFVPPMDGDTTAMTLTVGDHVMVVLGGEQKILPGSSINGILAKRIKEFEDKEGRSPGSRMRRSMKDDIVTELLPKALTKPSRTAAILNAKHGYIAVDTPSRKVAEGVVGELRRALGSFPALPINPGVAPRSVMTEWVSGEELPEGLALGEEVELRDAADSGAVVKFRKHELLCGEIEKHLESGKQATRLALSFNDHITFTIDEALSLRKFRLLDGAADSLADIDADDLEGELRGRFALMAAELEKAFEMLEPAFDLSSVEG